jgi:acetyl esterase/lipase
MPATPATPAAASAAPGGPRVITDIAYADPVGRAHLLDLYLPAGGGHHRPLVIWTGGSAWLADNGKDGAGPIAEVFNPHGYVVAGVSIRSSTQAPFPAQLHDIKAAIRWLRAHARGYGIDPHRIAVMGDSSGGWTTAMAALTGNDDPASRVRAGVAFYPPTDFRRMDGQMLPGACEAFNDMMGLTDCHNDPLSPESRLIGCAIQSSPERAAAANPVTYVGRREPPIMLLHGGNDLLVPHGQSVLLYEALKAKGATATFYSVPAAGHDWRALLDPSTQDGTTVRHTRGGRERVEHTPPTWTAIERFIRRALDDR